MRFTHPSMVVVALLVAAGAALAYRWLRDQRRAMLQSSGLAAPGSAPAAPVLMLAAVTLLLLGAGRPQATVPVPRASGTVILAFDVSNSMSAQDVAPTRLTAAQRAAAAFVEAQPETVDIGVVAFGQGALATQRPSQDRPATLAAINRLTISGGTSIADAILGSLSVIAGEPVNLGEEAPEGYHPDATIVLFSDGEDTGDTTATFAAAELAGTMGVHIETVGVGTAAGTTIEADGFQLATALNQELLTMVAELTTGSYHAASDERSLADVAGDLDLRLTTTDKLVELTGAVVVAALLLLTIAGLLTIRRTGRIL